MNTQNADLLVRSRKGELVAAVEVKNVPHLTAQLASEIRREIC